MGADTTFDVTCNSRKRLAPVDDGDGDGNGDGDGDDEDDVDDADRELGGGGGDGDGDGRIVKVLVSFPITMHYESSASDALRFLAKSR